MNTRAGVTVLVGWASCCAMGWCSPRRWAIIGATVPVTATDLMPKGAHHAEAHALVGSRVGGRVRPLGPVGGAHQSGCHRWHSCPSGTGSYVCGDLGYCAQCPDNQYCLGRQPRPPAPPSPTLSLLLNQAAFTAGQTLRLTMNATPRGAPVDVYVGLQLPSGNLFFLAPDGQFTATPQALTPAGLAQTTSAEIFRYTLTGAEPPRPVHLAERADGAWHHDVGQCGGASAVYRRRESVGARGSETERRTPCRCADSCWSCC